MIMLRDHLRQVKNGTVVRSIAALPGALRYRLTDRTRPIVFDLCSPIGMGGMLTHAVRLLHFAELEERSARLRFTNPLYARTPGADWLPDLFVPLTDTDSGAMHITVRNERDYELLGQSSTPDLARARALFKAHLRFAPATDVELAQARVRLPDLSRTVGVHYRGTDKVLEANRPSRQAALATVREALHRTGCRDVLVATDEPSFADWLCGALPDAVLHEYARPATPPGVPVHFAPGDPLRKSLEAVTLIRLLAACGALVRSPSYLSAWAQLLAPAMPVRILDPEALRTPLFPERELFACARWIGEDMQFSAS